jgi:hypothetical protein
MDRDTMQASPLAECAEAGELRTSNAQANISATILTVLAEAFQVDNADISNRILQSFLLDDATPKAQ